ncbi:hypothetical protein [Chondromyces apiculatus]|uniref:Uncharacterized protein n=1 Tax=Chondromyces apiculatus DSM 436 TaxID=1192034 RepID=A0A017SXZ2_9BACT|nr:hypothetical protein [Chondromyces apiculatus]EYF01480.1 Hypothetical protein CAP_8263 [Chondromyces apiculatus DSM 436]
MRGRAYALWMEILEIQGPPSARSSFAMARLILRTRALPEEITPEVDDPGLEQRLEEALLDMPRLSDMHHRHG